jgi:hypothetical protein
MGELVFRDQLFDWLDAAGRAFDERIALFRRMTGSPRPEIAPGLPELPCEPAREGIRRPFPQAEAAEVERPLHERIGTTA